jgi:Ankyrin repeats (3 copies)
MFGFGSKTGESKATTPAPRQGGGAGGSHRLRLMRAGFGLLLASVALFAYQYLRGILDDTLPVVPAVLSPVAEARAAPAPSPAPAPGAVPRFARVAALSAPNSEARVEPNSMPEYKAWPEAAAKAKPGPIAETMSEAKPGPVRDASAHSSKLMQVAQAPTTPTPAMSAPQATLAAVRSGPAPVTLKYNDVMTAVLYGDREAVTQLLDLGRWVDKPDGNGLTPLMAAVLARNEDMVKLLLDHSADPNAQAPGGEVPLEMAQKNGDGEIESLLRQAGARY